MSTVTIRHEQVSQAPNARPARGEWAHPITGQRMSAWSPARSEREETRRDTRLSGHIATAGLSVAGEVYAREMVASGDCGYRSAIAQAREIFG